MEKKIARRVFIFPAINIVTAIALIPVMIAFGMITPLMMSAILLFIAAGGVLPILSAAVLKTDTGYLFKYQIIVNVISLVLNFVPMPITFMWDIAVIIAAVVLYITESRKFIDGLTVILTDPAVYFLIMGFALIARF